MKLGRILLPAFFRGKRAEKIRRPDLASQWQLMWWKFRKHKLAMVGMVLLGIFVLMALFAEFISPYPPYDRNPAYVAGAPMGIHFFEEDGTFHLRPFVYGNKAQRDPITLRMKFVTDTSQIWKLQLFSHGKPYQAAWHYSH